ncbi:MAG: hypothetical protein HND57_13550 [Planctomycetes bacterium]|nr:hypothetical protein [Planctomycetota bacterium]
MRDRSPVRGAAHPMWGATVLRCAVVCAVCLIAATAQAAATPPADATHWVLLRDHVTGGRWYEVLLIDPATGQVSVRHDGLRESLNLADVLAIVSKSAVSAGATGRVVVMQPSSEERATGRFDHVDAGEAGTGAAATIAKAVLETVDGVRLFGSPVHVSGADERNGEGGDVGGRSSGSFRWKHDLLGIVSMDLASIARVRLQPSVAWPDIVTADGIQLDVLRLSNGDVISGFVDGWADPVPVETADGRRIEVAFDRIGAIRFGNARMRPSGVQLWLASGEVLPCDRVTALDRDAFRVMLLPGHACSLARSEVQAVVFDSGSFVGLADLALMGVESDGGEVDGSGVSVSGPPLATPVLINPGMPAGLSSVEIHGPGVFRFRLPAGATRFACEVEVPASARLWADLDLIIGTGRAQDAHRVHISADRSLTSIDVPLSDDGSGSFVIGIEPAGRGPILDVVQLRFARVLVGGE